MNVKSVDEILGYGHLLQQNAAAEQFSCLCLVHLKQLIEVERISAVPVAVEANRLPFPVPCFNLFRFTKIFFLAKTLLLC